MSFIDLDVPRSALFTNVTVASLAAVGMLTLVPPSGGRDQAVFAIPILSVLLAIVLVLRTRDSMLRAREHVENAVTTDQLTGVAAARAGEEVLRMEFAAAQREQGRLLTIVLVRVEGLDEYRARYGDRVTDRFLRETGLVLSRHRRGMHMAARSETQPGTFLSILSGVDRKGAAVYATRVRRDLLRMQGAPRPSGISVGIAAYDMSMGSAKDLVRKAMFALKQGAAAGGKVVVMAADLRA